MKLVHKCIGKDKSGSVTLLPEVPDDMWHAYNLVAQGDNLTSTTIRKVITEYSTGRTDSNRIRTTLTIKVEDIDFDTKVCTLRVKGRNIEQNQYVKMGAYHTIDLELNSKFTLSKESWDTIALERINLACDPGQKADLVAVLMQEGIAHVYLVTASRTIEREKINKHIPKKRKGKCAQNTKALEEFFKSVYKAIVKHVNFDIVKCVLIASPGIVKDQFYEYVFHQASEIDKTLLKNKSAFVLAHSPSAFKHSFKEILSDPALASRLANTKAVREIKCLDHFQATLMNNPNKACYGLKQIQMAIESQAVDTLLISDKLFRCCDIGQRKLYVELVNSVRSSGGDVKMFSSLHPSGEQLDQLTGIAAILRFPMDELDEESNSDTKS